jgi:hypothetical protein
MQYLKIRGYLEGLVRQPTGKALLANNRIELAPRSSYPYIGRSIAQAEFGLLFKFHIL